MKRILLFFAVLLMPLLAHAQLRVTTTASSSVSGTPLPNFNNNAGAMVVSFEELISGSPSTVSIPIQGCMRGGTCDTLETNTGTSNSIRNPTISKVYDYFLITPSWTGGTNVLVTVNLTLTTAQTQGGGGGGGGSVSSVFGRTGAVVASSGDYSYSQISSTPQLAQTIAAASHKFVTAYSAVSGLFTQGQAACGDLSDAGALCNLTLNTHALLFGPSGALTSPTTNGPCIVRFNVTASTAVDPDCALPGVLVNAQSGSYLLAYTDRAAFLKLAGGTTATVTLCQITGTCAGSFPFVVENWNSGNATLTANAADTITVGNVTTATGGSATIPPMTTAFIYQDSASAPGNWEVVIFATMPLGGAASATYSTRVTSDFTCLGSSTCASLAPITGLSIPLPANTAANYWFDCQIYYSDSATTSSAIIFGVQAVTTAPTSARVGMEYKTNGSAFNSNVISPITNTTATAVTGSIQPATTNVLSGHIFGTIEQPSGAASNWNIMAQIAAGATFTATKDSVCRAGVIAN